MTRPRLLHPQQLEDMLLYQLWQLLTRASAPVLRLCEDEFGITRREWRMLAQVAANEGLSPSQLADCAGLDRARTSRAISALVDKHLLQRTPRPGNRREAQLTLTPQGRALHAALLPRVAEVNQRLVADALTPPQAQLLDDLLQRLAHSAGAYDGGPLLDRHKPDLP